MSEKQRPGGDVIFTGRDREFLTLVGRGYKHKQIASELGVTTDSSQDRVRSLILETGFHSATQTVVYAVDSGQISQDEVFRQLPPHSGRICTPRISLLSEEVKVIPSIACGPAKVPVPRLNRGEVNRQAYILRSKLGVNSNSQLVLTAIDMGCISTAEILSHKRPPVVEESPEWDDLTRKEKLLVEGVWLGKSNKEYARSLNVSIHFIEKLLHGLRIRTGSENNYQLALRFFNEYTTTHNSKIPVIQLNLFEQMSADEYRLLHEYIKDQGRGIDHAPAVAEKFEWTVDKVHRVRNRVKMRIGLKELDQICLLYLFSLQGEHVDFPDTKKLVDSQLFRQSA